jgi:hypothetical protein
VGTGGYIGLYSCEGGYGIVGILVMCVGLWIRPWECQEWRWMVKYVKVEKGAGFG